MNNALKLLVKRQILEVKRQILEVKRQILEVAGGYKKLLGLQLHIVDGNLSLYAIIHADLDIVSALFWPT